ncbi:MAG: potassium transporter TrkG [Bdellovibrionota bacterium]
MPEASAGDPVSGLDAAFTAVSAVCVTGLIVLDTPIDFSYFGQGIILFLIQMGGLGIMALSSIAAFILGRRLSLRQEDLVAGASGYQQRSEIRSLLRDILLVTFAFEAVGTVLLTIGFAMDGMPWVEAIWPALFTSISAFCNAGFALFSDSLIGYQSNELVLHTVGALIVFGGLSPGFLLALFRLRDEQPPACSLKRPAS